jgi:hypothetical protein
MLNPLRVHARSALCRGLRLASRVCGSDADGFWVSYAYRARRRNFLYAKAKYLIEHDRILIEGEE